MFMAPHSQQPYLHHTPLHRRNPSKVNIPSTTRNSLKAPYTLLVLSHQIYFMKTSNSKSSHHITTTSPLLGELAFTLSNRNTSLTIIGVLNNFKLSQQSLLHISNIVPYHSFQLNYPSKGN